MSDEVGMQNAQCTMHNAEPGNGAEKRRPLMGRAKALGILAHMAERPDATLDEVIALQMAFRALAKRMFDRERNFKRRHGAEGRESPEEVVAINEAAAEKEGGAE